MNCFYVLEDAITQNNHVKNKFNLDTDPVDMFKSITFNIFGHELISHSFKYKDKKIRIKLIIKLNEYNKIQNYKIFRSNKKGKFNRCLNLNINRFILPLMSEYCSEYYEIVKLMEDYVQV